MLATDVAVIGGGQAGLALSRCLTEERINHVVFERGEIAGRWRTRTWASLNLLTPNWLNTLPALPYEGLEPDGFMACGAFADRLSGYAASFSAPVMTGTEVFSVEPVVPGFMLRTSAGAWKAYAVVVATGHCDIPDLPPLAQQVGSHATSLHSSQYRSSSELPDGKVLIVGASASGVQIADELQRSGREVLLSVGRHTRLPRTWRGRDIHWWLHQTGMLSQRASDLPNLAAAMAEPAPQLAGRSDRADVDLASLQVRGVRLAGRTVAFEEGAVAFADDLAQSTALADAKQNRVLEQIDCRTGCHLPLPAISSVDLGRPAPRRLSLADEGIAAVVWATGYRRDFRWLRLPVRAAAGDLIHHEGITSVPGLFALGFRLLRKRDSHFIGGVGSDARAIAGEVSTFLRSRSQQAA
jgi:putative flavoprotein involved in K+ transport